jgi:ubiquitin C-terminal hydrolase
MDNNEVIVPTFGFINNGNICYFNSLLQCILNCKYIMHYLINNQVPKNELQLYFKNKFIRFCELYNNDNINSEKEFIKETSIFSFEILQLLLKKYKHINIHEQQSSSEFFLYLIEELDIIHFFKMRHQINVHCGNCKNITSKIDECYHFEMFCEDNSKYFSDNTLDIDNFMYSVNVINDYKCDKCKKTSKSLYEKQALNISKYFVIILNKYFNKVLIEYPNTFELTVKNSENYINIQNNYKYNNTFENYIPQNCVWENISQIEHSGNLSSGHYTSICKRLKNVFLFNDMKVELTEYKKIHPSKNTYMVFYEKQY